MRLVLFLLVLSFSISSAQGLTLEAAKGKTQFLAVGRPSALKISGTGIGPTGDMNFTKGEGQVLLNGEASMDLSSFDTGISMRDRHMKEKYLEVGKFKRATLKFVNAKLPADILQKGGEIQVPATLNLHGLEKPVQVTMTFKSAGDKILSSSRFKLKLSEYAIEIPTFSGITVADEVEITADTEVQATQVKGVL